MKRTAEFRRLNAALAAAFAALCTVAPRPAAAEDVRVVLTDEAAGGTVRYIGGYGLAQGLADPEAVKLLAGTGINCTKFWIVEPRNWRNYAEFLGPDFKEVTIRQATKHPETINWEDELANSTAARDLASFEQQLRLLKDFGAQPVINFKTKLHGDELKRRMYWRHVFLMNYYLNKVKGYGFTLWECGCEDAREGPEQLEVGSDALREAARLTGVPVKIAGPGEDGDVDRDFNTILKCDWANRADALSFHTFQWPEEFPKLGSSEYKGWRGKPVKDALESLDGIQKQWRPDAPLLPYWDTGWAWRTATSNEGPEVQPPAPFTSLVYIGRIIQECESRVQVNLYCRLYGPRESQDALRSEDGKVVATPLFFAMRMMARANAGEKERLRLAEKPDAAAMQALATRSGSQVFVTCLSRQQDAVLKVTIKGLDPYRGKKYVIRRHDGKDLKDDVAGEGVLDGDLTVELPPLTAFQIVIERK